MFYLPFLFWDSYSLVRSLLFYVGGSRDYQAPIHPIEGLSFGRLLVGIGKLPSIYSSHPFWIYQLILGTIFLMLIFFLFRKQLKNINFILFAYTCLLSLIWFFNRYFLESHLAFISVLVSVSYVWSQGKN
jgi:prolipoprotein diacylglyceryltransferase